MFHTDLAVVCFWLTVHLLGEHPQGFILEIYMGKYNQNSSGVYLGFKWTSTNKQVLVFTASGIKTARVKYEKDFNFEKLFRFAVFCGKDE